MGYQTIAIDDKLYKKLKKLKGNKSFSEYISELLGNDDLEYKIRTVVQQEIDKIRSY